MILPIIYHKMGFEHFQTHCGLGTPYGVRNLGQHWLRYWLIVWQHRAITWTNVDWYQRSQLTFKLGQFHKRCPNCQSLKSLGKLHSNLKFHSNFPGANELKINPFFRAQWVHSTEQFMQNCIQESDSQLLPLTHCGLGDFNGWVLFNPITTIDGWDIFCEIALRRMSLDLTDDKSTLVQVMAWCRQATSHYLSQCWPSSLAPCGVTKPQWVNEADLFDESETLIRLECLKYVDVWFQFIYVCVLCNNYKKHWTIYQQ